MFLQDIAVSQDINKNNPLGMYMPPYSSSTGLNFTPISVAKRTRAVENIIIIIPRADNVLSQEYPSIFGQLF